MVEVRTLKKSLDKGNNNYYYGSMSLKILAKPKLKKMRELSKQLASDVAYEIRISTVQLWRIEANKQGVDIRLARKFCNLYKRPFAELFEISENKA